ncbi:MAG: MASE1 domain-containing protein [Actinomycetota bacterium]
MRKAALMVGLFVAYVASAKLGLGLPGAHGGVTPVWAPTGISLVALVLFGPSLWPAVALGAIVANATSGASGFEAALISVGNTLEAVVGSMLLRRVDFRPGLDRVRDVFALVVFGAVVSTAIAATNGVTTLWAFGDISGARYPGEWLLWWIGDGMGDLIVAPLLFVLYTRPWRRLDLGERIEGLLLLGLLVAVGSAVFLGGLWRYPHLLFPILIWSVLRFRQFGAVTSSFVVAACAVAGAVHGTTPLGNGGTTEILQMLEALTGGVAFSVLILGAVLAERGEAESELARAHASLAEAQELAHIGSWEWDIPSDTITWSDELFRVYGLEPQSIEITYEAYLDQVHPDDRRLIQQAVQEAAAERRPFAFQHRIQLADGRHRWVQGRGRVILGADDKPIRMVGTSQDITDRKQVDELRDSILSAVSHELRTPLTSIIGFAMTLKERGIELSEATRKEIVEHLTEQAEKLGRLLSDLLDIDRLRRGFVQANLRPTDVGELVARIALEQSANGRVINVEAEPAIAEVDAPKVERIVDNLLANAIAYTAADSEISVRVESQPTGVLISVDDRGPGVAEDQREAIFEIFNRGSENLTVSGTGIGLSLVAQFTALHGGRAWVDENPGGGASFKVFLPARPAD